ncbi:MAG: FHA domain-containing protein [Gemmataceae bacterium]|nr:FHA domain-containing protein [Gemmataceae bacterium]
MFYFGRGSINSMLAYLELLKGGRVGQVLTLGPAGVKVGRDASCKIRIPSSKISRQHCNFFWKDEALFLQDLKSTNGTFLNGKKLSGQIKVRHGDQVAIGSVIFRVNLPNGKTHDVTLMVDDGELAEEIFEAQLAEESPGSWEADLRIPVSDSDLIDLPEASPEDLPIPLASEQPTLKPQGRSRKNKTQVGSDEFIEVVNKGINPKTDDNEISLNLPSDSNLRDIISKLEGVEDN